jgi:acyl-coenzyme A synthetase/AMP-(fatty) acid ligase
MTSQISDMVPRDNPGAREIGFAIPEHYNAGRILFDNLSHRRGDRLALTGPGGTRTYAQLCAEASQWGHGLQSLGLKRGDRILMFLDDTPVYPAAFFGAVRSGFVPLLINTLTPPDLLQFYLSDAGAAVAVAEAEFTSRFNAEACEDTPLQTLIVVNGAAGDHAVSKAFMAQQWLQGFSTDLPEADTKRDDMAFWMYSSGSTGRPKGIVHLQHDMAYSEQAFARNVLKLTPDDICFSVPKIFFAYGFGNAITFPFSVGAATLLLPGQPKPATIFEAIEKYRPSVFYGLPTLYTSLTKADGAAATDFSSLRMALSAAEVLSADVFNGWRSSKDWAPRKRCTSISPTSPRRKSSARRACACPAMKSCSRIKTAARLATMRKAFCGYAATPTRRCTGTGPTSRRRPSARAAGSTPATVFCAMPTVSTSSAAAPTI